MRGRARGAVAIAALALASCAAAVSPATREAFGALRVSASECRAPGPETVTPDAMGADLDVLARVLARGYAGYTTVGDEARWAGVFDELREAVGDAPRSAEAFRDLLAERLRFADDNHLGFWIRGADGARRWRAAGAHQQAALSEARFVHEEGAWRDEEGRALGACAEHLVAVWQDGALTHRLVALAATPPATLACDAPDDAPRAFALRPIARTRDLGPAFEREDAELPWLRVRTLGMAQRAALDRFVASAAEVREAPVVVLDLRGNGGGSDRFLLAWFSHLTSQPLRYFDTLRVSSDVELQGALTFWSCEAEAAAGDDAGAAWVRARVAQAERALETAMRERGPFVDRIEGTYTEPGRAPAPFRGRLILLVDRGCGSACETAVLLARQLEGALVVGENTEGTMKVGELRHYRLPATGVWVAAGRRAHSDPALGTFPEGRGYLPDVWLDGTSTERDVIALARCLTTPPCPAALDAARATRRRRPRSRSPRH